MIKFFAIALLVFGCCLFFTACSQKEETQKPIIAAPTADKLGGAEVFLANKIVEGAASTKKQQEITQQKTDNNAVEKQSKETFEEEAAARSESAEEKIVDKNARKKLSGAADAAAGAESEMDTLFSEE